ncbi:MAG: pilus assembly protein [Verrucomicrobia bacterium]|nr:pilus assembly protein [Verrucomicrobiota bacterium]
MKARTVIPAPRPRGQALAELAILLPVLIILVLGAADFGRIYYHFVTVESAAAAGVQYGCVDTTKAADTDGIRLAAMRQVQDITNRSVVVVSSLVTNSILTVNVKARFVTFFHWPLMPTDTLVSRSAQMRILK